VFVKFIEDYIDEKRAGELTELSLFNERCEVFSIHHGLINLRSYNCPFQSVSIDAALRRGWLTASGVLPRSLTGKDQIY